MLDRKYDNALAEVMAHCANDRKIQNALVDQVPCIIALQDRALAYIRRSTVFSEEGEIVQYQAAKLIVDDLLRFAPIGELFWDPEVTEIMVIAPDDVWVECQGRIKPVDVQFHDEEHVLRTIDRIVSPDGCRCDNRGRQFYACSLLCKGTPFDGCRVSAIRDDTDGHWKLNIRKRGNDVPVDAPHQHIYHGCLVESMADYYRALVSARMGISDGCPDKKTQPPQLLTETPGTWAQLPRIPTAKKKEIS